VFGPHMFNFQEATRYALAAGAAIQVKDAEQAIRMARELLRDPQRCASMGVAGARLCAAHRGATERHLTVARVLLRASAPR